MMWKWNGSGIRKNIKQNMFTCLPLQPHHLNFAYDYITHGKSELSFNFSFQHVRVPKCVPEDHQTNYPGECSQHVSAGP